MLSQFSHVWLLVTLWTIAWRLLCPWDSLGKNTGVGCHALLQEVFLTQGLHRIFCGSCRAGRFFTDEALEAPVLEALTFWNTSTPYFFFPFCFYLFWSNFDRGLETRYFSVFISDPQMPISTYNLLKMLLLPTGLLYFLYHMWNIYSY